jgi:hypothetical protein
MFFFSNYSFDISPVLSLLALNHRSNSSEESNMSGRIKFNRLHSSCKLFWSGVPVNNSLKLVLRDLTTCDNMLSSFLILCASSIMRYFHLIRRRYFKQIRTPSKLVTTTSNLPLKSCYRRITSLYYLVAISFTTRQHGNHLLNSLTQLLRVIFGAIIK